MFRELKWKTASYTKVASLNHIMMVRLLRVRTECHIKLKWK
jgi:hypothetical protein